MYQALYRKYRPKSFDDVVGQSAITTTLKNQIALGRIGHAYLFTGSRGTGKTSCSKIIAKAVNCPNQTDGNPCGVCSICRGIDDGSILDVVEIDAASNNGVDDIRQLREEANFTPSIARYRVYIIDETHMLSTAAFNALLKIMEEPPEHVIFILATTEVHKVPATILSRCQRFDFQRIEPQFIEARLQTVCSQEQISLEPQAAHLIARLSEGGMRDALSLLDVCRTADSCADGSSSMNAPVITLETVEKAAGLAAQDCLFSMADAVLRQDIPELLGLIETMHQASIDYEKLCVQLLSHYRELMMAKAMEHADRVSDMLPQDRERLKQQAAGYTMPQILYCLTTLQDALSRMNKTVQTRTELEMAVMRLTSPEMEYSLEAIHARLDRLEKALASGMLTRPYPVQNTVSAAENSAAESPVPKSSPKQKGSAASQKNVSNTNVQSFALWDAVLRTLATTNKALAGTLVDSRAYLQGDSDHAIVLIDCQNPFFLELIRNNDYAKESLHQAFLRVAGRDYRIGPYRREQHAAPAETDPMEQMLRQAQAEGVPVNLLDDPNI